MVTGIVEEGARMLRDLTWRDLTERALEAARLDDNTLDMASLDRLTSQLASDSKN